MLPSELPSALQELSNAQARLDLYAAIIDHLPIGVLLIEAPDLDDPTSLRLVTSNPAAAAATGFSAGSYAGQLMTQLLPNFVESGLPALYLSALRSGTPCILGEMHYDDQRLAEQTFAVQAIPVSPHHICVMFENVTDRKRAEQMHRQTLEQEEQIRAQAALMRELTTPLIPISDSVVVMPLVGGIDSCRAQQVMETMLEGISTSGAKVAIMDITGVPVVDTQVAAAFLRTAQSVRLLGAEVILTGIRPEIAQTLVGMGAEMSGITTRATLQSGIGYALRTGNKGMGEVIHP